MKNQDHKNQVYGCVCAWLEGCYVKQRFKEYELVKEDTQVVTTE